MNFLSLDFRVDALCVSVRKKEFSLAGLVSVMTSTIHLNVKEVAAFITRPMEIRFAIVQSDNIRFLTAPKTIAFHYSLEVIIISNFILIHFALNTLFNWVLGPCPNHQVFVITENGRLSCEPLECLSINGGDDGRFQQLVPDEKGTCFALGSRGPCLSTQLLGYDIFKRQLQCVVDPFSPESSASQQNELVEAAEFRQLFSQDYISERIEWIEYLMEPIERQDNAGILQLPSSLPDSLLQPCWSGTRPGNNFKCANPLV
jgi:hypothetical protein